ncbi:MAG: hypothetical protein HWN65_22450 [Candidatus Helarchaeota archaeon]|nr:hypothetical protein [Candidatus Helarchaeota archaeon]
MSEYPWFSKLVSKYWPEIETLIPPDETIQYKFIGIFEGLGSRTSGLYVITDKKIYSRGKPKTGAFTPVWKLAGAKAIQVIPLDAIYELIDKKSKFILRIYLDYMGEKYTGKTGKFLIAPHQGKEKGIGKEPKTEWLNRLNEYKKFIMSKMSK